MTLLTDENLALIEGLLEKHAVVFSGEVSQRVMDLEGEVEQLHRHRAELFRRIERLERLGMIPRDASRETQAICNEIERERNGGGT